MLKKGLFAIATLVASMGFAFAQVDVNKADQAGLDGIRGIGPSTSKAILEERKKGGDFKDWDDLEKRVKGIGDKSAIRLSDAGLTVNGQPRTKTSSSSSGAEKKPKSGSDAKSKQAAKEDSK